MDLPPAPNPSTNRPLDPNVPISQELLPEKIFDDGTPDPNLRVRGDVTRDVTGMRIHEVALIRALNATYLLTQGYPVPVIMGTPGDAFNRFRDICQRGGPFDYLFKGPKPVYGPYPDNVRYPLISIKRLGYTPRIAQSYGLRRFRRLGYVTQSGSVVQDDLHSVLQSRMPTAWDYRYQVDHFCLRPETQARFIHQTMRLFGWAGGAMQTWIAVRYPGFFGRDNRQVRCALEGNIDDATPEEPGENKQVYRTSYSVVIEGYCPDLDYEVVPVVWKVVMHQHEALDPNVVEQFFTHDLRVDGNNVVFNALPNLPPKTNT